MFIFGDITCRKILFFASTSTYKKNCSKSFSKISVKTIELCHVFGYTNNKEAIL